MIPPLENLKFWAGAGAAAFILSASFHLDGPSDFEAAQATEASLNDALAQAQAEPPANAHGSAPKSHSHPTAAPIAGFGT